MNEMIVPTDYSSNTDSLLSGFINERTNSYIEPSRKNTPRGNNIGLFFRKYYATLLCMYNFKLKDIATSADISYAVLTVWRTQSVFKDTIKDHYSDFTVFFINHLSARLSEGKINFTEHIEDESDGDLISERMPPSEIKEFADMQNYNPLLLKHIDQSIHVFVNGLLNTNVIAAVETLLAYVRLRDFGSQRSLTSKNKIRDHRLRQELLIYWLKYYRHQLSVGPPFDHVTMQRIIATLSFFNSSARNLD